MSSLSGQRGVDDYGSLSTRIGLMSTDRTLYQNLLPDFRVVMVEKLRFLVQAIIKLLPVQKETSYTLLKRDMGRRG